VRRVELQISDVAFGGNGVGRTPEGKAVFVPFTIEGERVAAAIAREKKQFADAQLLEVLDPAPPRVQPECPYFGTCGGCAYQHMSYEHQLQVKTRQVQQVLGRIGRIKDAPVQPMLPSPKPYGYRNRITVHAEDGVIGYYTHPQGAAARRRLLDVKQCPIAVPPVNEALTELRARKPRDGHYTLRANAGPRVFEQTNNEVADGLAQLIRDALPADKRQLLIDAFCGAGFFAKRLLDRFERVIGIEWDRFAVQAAERNASATERYINGAVDDELPRLLESSPLDETTIIVDPPAAGLTEKTRATLQQFAASTLFYVSCNPATLARDLQQLQSGFRIVAVTPLDMFPQTAEIEVLAQLERA
jgi:23S rRNA (uracil1939-C5)-methyltransferase